MSGTDQYLLQVTVDFDRTGCWTVFLLHRAHGRQVIGQGTVGDDPRGMKALKAGRGRVEAEAAHWAEHRADGSRLERFP